MSIGPIYTHAAKAAHLPDSPDSPEIPDNPDSKVITPSASFPISNPLWRKPIYTHAAKAAHLPDSPDSPGNPDNPDSKVLHLQLPSLYPILSGGRPYILVPLRRHTSPIAPTVPGIPTTPIQKYYTFSFLPYIQSSLAEGHIYSCRFGGTPPR